MWLVSPLGLAGRRMRERSALRWSSASRSTLPTLNEYCAVAQKEIATSRVPARNVLVDRLPGVLARLAFR